MRNRLPQTTDMLGHCFYILYGSMSPNTLKMKHNITSLKFFSKS